MKVCVQIGRGIESLFGTRDENIRILEEGLSITTHLLNDSLEIEGDEAAVLRAESILEDYIALVAQGQSFSNGGLNGYLRVLVGDAGVTLRGLVESGRRLSFGKPSS